MAKKQKTAPNVVELHEVVTAAQEALDTATTEFLESLEDIDDAAVLMEVIEQINEADEDAIELSKKESKDADTIKEAIQAYYASEEEDGEEESEDGDDDKEEDEEEDAFDEDGMREELGKKKLKALVTMAEKAELDILEDKKFMKLDDKKKVAKLIDALVEKARDEEGEEEEEEEDQVLENLTDAELLETAKDTGVIDEKELKKRTKALKEKALTKKEKAKLIEDIEAAEEEE